MAMVEFFRRYVSWLWMKQSIPVMCTQPPFVETCATQRHTYMSSRVLLILDKCEAETLFGDTRQDSCSKVNTDKRHQDDIQREQIERQTEQRVTTNHRRLFVRPC